MQAAATVPAAAPFLLVAIDQHGTRLYQTDYAPAVADQHVIKPYDSVKASLPPNRYFPSLCGGGSPAHVHGKPRRPKRAASDEVRCRSPGNRETASSEAASLE